MCRCAEGPGGGDDPFGCGCGDGVTDDDERSGGDIIDCCFGNFGFGVVRVIIGVGTVGSSDRCHCPSRRSCN